VTSTIAFSLHVNGEAVLAHVPPRLNLADFVREHLHLTGTHVGCEHGVCGACTVRVNGDIVRSCLTLAVQAAGHQVTTLRGLMGPGEAMHPLQECFLRRGSSQCGFCTPGMILTSLDLIRTTGRPTRDQIRYALVGNLCRCTGYTKILDAIEEYADQ